jgi:archaemetzincin
MKLRILFFSAVIIILGVSGYTFLKNNWIKRTTAHEIKNKSRISTTSKTITILPLGTDLSEGFVWGTYTEIRKFLPEVGLDALTPIPATAYYKPRGRYRADSLIHWMRRQAKPDQVFIGITDVDISTTKGKYQDWGVMGLGYCPGNAAIASRFRLKNKSLFWKVAIHELGHTTGLPHCPVKTCFMRDAEGGDPTGEEKEFCSKCKSVLVQNGWKL